MASEISARFETTGWEEAAVDEVDGAGKVTRARTTRTFSGGIEGEAVVEYVMAYADDGTATFVGLERITGKVGGREGSFVVQHAGRFDGGAATASLTVVPGAGSGDLKLASGEGEFYAPDMGGSVTLSLSFD